MHAKEATTNEANARYCDKTAKIDANGARERNVLIIQGDRHTRSALTCAVSERALGRCHNVEGFKGLVEVNIEPCTQGCTPRHQTRGDGR